MISRKDGSSAVVGMLPAPARLPPATAGSEPAALAADQTLGFRLPHWLDPVSALIGLKTAVGVVIAQTVALWLDWNPSSAMLAVLSLQTAYFGSTFAKAILRMAGALVGGGVGLLLLHLLVQERALLITAVALLAGVIIYIQQGSRHPYAWLFGGVSLVFVSLANASQPEGAFEAAVAWVSGNALGITVVLVMHGVLWPHTGERQFEAQLRGMLSEGARLLALKVGATLQGRAPSAEIDRLEIGLIRAMPQLRLALGIAGHDTGQIAAFRPGYQLLIEEVQALITLIITLGESLRICEQRPVAMAVLRESETIHDVTHLLQTQLEALVADVEGGRPGERVEANQAAVARVGALTDDLFEALRARPHDAMDVATLAAALAKASELASWVVAIRETLARLAEPQGTKLAEQQLRVLAQPHVYLGLAGERWRKAAVASLAVGSSALLWIATNWPQPERLFLYAFVPTALGAFVPQFPVRGLLRSLIYGPVIAAILYFGIMPPLSDIWQLAPFLILALFPCCYFANSANRATAITGMYSGFWTVDLIDLTQGQIYSLSGYAENLIGIVGGVLVAVIAISLLDAPIPEQRFRDHLRGFFAVCEQIARENTARVASDPTADIRLRAGRARQAEQIRMCHMWSAQLDRDRFSHDEREKPALLMAAMRSLMFRQSAVERAHLDLPAAGPLRQLAEPAAALGARARRAYGILETRTARCEPAAPVPAISELAAPYRSWLEALRSIPATDPDAKELVRKVLVLIGLHHALVYAVHDCHARFNALDWRLWGEAHF